MVLASRKREIGRDRFRDGEKQKVRQRDGKRQRERHAKTDREGERGYIKTRKYKSLKIQIPTSMHGSWRNKILVSSIVSNYYHSYKHLLLFTFIMDLQGKVQVLGICSVINFHSPESNIVHREPLRSKTDGQTGLCI